MNGNELRDRRVQMELTQLDLALRFGISLSTLQRWEHSLAVPSLVALALKGLSPALREESKAAAQTAKATARAAAGRTKHRRDPRNHRDQDAWSKCYCDTCGASWKAVRLNANGDHRLDLVDKGDGSCDRPS